MIPACTRVARRFVRTFRAMPRLAWNSSKRDSPRNASRRMRGVHHSPMISRVRAIEQFIPAKLVRSTSTGYHCVA